jgi:hypothetical protein
MSVLTAAAGVGGVEGSTQSPSEAPSSTLDSHLISKITTARVGRRLVTSQAKYSERDSAGWESFPSRALALGKRHLEAASDGPDAQNPKPGYLRLSSSTENQFLCVSCARANSERQNWINQKRVLHTSKLQRLLRLVHLVHAARRVVSVLECPRTASHATRDLRHASQLENCLRRWIRLSSMRGSTKTCSSGGTTVIR